MDEKGMKNSLAFLMKISDCSPKKKEGMRNENRANYGEVERKQLYKPV